MQHHPVCRRILALEQRMADLTARLAMLQHTGDRAQLNQVKRDLDGVLLDLREAHNERTYLLETLGMPPVLGWASRDGGGDVMTTT